MMEWLTGLALLPALICGAMCLGGMALAALGLRRTTSDSKSRADSAAATSTGIADQEPVREP